ncbi:hypothetical protein L1987_54853 [Smallanthus sonchifolius]|uniref:Uncharacterized protein n=1 Tax=Smallanthus sonchifolius TaxID=185202 RepID=A0ACB9E8R9_9ASTR|nr:hypothetical protein L1987_54853 [Smallanthus sonchifolius]
MIKSVYFRSMKLQSRKGRSCPSSLLFILHPPLSHPSSTRTLQPLFFFQISTETLENHLQLLDPRSSDQISRVSFSFLYKILLLITSRFFV